MNILVTGSSGYIGTRLGWHLREAYPHDNIFRLDTKQGFDYAEFQQAELDVVFHLGAISTIMDSFARADEMMAVNALNLIPFLQNNVIKKFLFTSTGAIYGNMSHPMKEDEAKWMDCLCPYAQSKYVAEGITRRLCPNHVIFRLGNVFGGDYTPRKEWLAPRHFMEDNPIVLYGGEQIRDFIHVDVVCNALIKAAQDPEITGTFNIARGEGVRLEDLARAFSVQRGVKLIYEPHRTGDANYVVFDVTKAKEAGLIPKELPPNDYRS
jgi:nucleoside-diphosphate-sugar epimerase